MSEFITIESPRFDIGDRVYHATPESDQGFVIEAKYSNLTKLWMYNVSFFATQNEMWYYEHELSEQRIYK